ncbi:MAG TPA: ATP-binding cassette domain-containing protein [Gaiellaceae bacterium]|nr:ATP-binding cassette domain-containing protein [Gaiellaceae bacterium]
MPVDKVTQKGGDTSEAAPLERRPILELRGISKRFGAVEALSEVDFEVFPGEVVALVGDNGAGKSTLIKCVAGTHMPDDGTILFDGEEVRIHTPSDATRLGIETVYQDLALCDNLDVVQNMFLGRERVASLVPPVVELLSELEMEKRALDVLESLNVTTIGSVRTRVAALSGGQRQSVAISRAVMWTAKLVILDEPTAALGVAQTEQVLALIRRLREQGLGVVVITHNLHEVFEIADRIIVLRLGRRVATFEHATTTPEDVVAAITGARGQAA